MDIQVFIRRRKEKGLSQIELSHGICTQATLSRFENHGQIPSMKILSQLCARLQLDVGDLFASVNTKEVATNKLLDKIEESIVTMDYELSEKLIGTIQKDQLNDEQKIHLLYLRGFTQVLQGKKMEDDLFYFNKILAEQYENQDTYLHLAYAGLGLVYQKQNDIEKAEYFFTKAIQEVEKHQLEKMEDVWRVLMVLYHSAMFFNKNNNYKKSNELLKKGIELCSQFHITYYLSRLYYQLAMNSLESNADKEEVKLYLNDAAAFARINSNDELLTEIEKINDSL
ncbi:helix-turn-helix domain-containing protein [uncultured Granulicatella sp.]|uniref:helix-turn-helix domain-containing protein n=1 Tax=uncultured Granulicatella sp. TaxID=316089 RepID=UPI0028D1496E|nr:helix-turn-helix domain-containing protein [uncultured Granulicatella sp.]